MQTQERPPSAVLDGLHLPPNAIAGYSKTTLSAYSGPIPHPEMLREYDALDPGRAAKILNWAEDQSRHRMWMEKTVVVSDARRSWAGLICGFIVALACIGCGTLVAWWGHPKTGGSIATGTVVSLVTAFIYGTSSRRKEREHKAGTMAKLRKH